MSTTQQREPSLPPAHRSDDGGPATPAAAPPQPAPGTSRTLALLTEDGLAYLVYWTVILVLLGQAGISILRPPQDSLAAGVLTSGVCLIWAFFCLGMGILRGKRPDGGDLPPAEWLPVITSAGCLASMAVVRAAVDMAGPWAAELVVSGLLVAAVTVWAGGLAGVVTGSTLTALMLAAPLSGPPGQSLLRVPLSSVVAGTAIIGAGLAVALAVRWLRRSAQRLQATLDERDELLVRERSLRAAAEVAAEVERSLHDTALNTLETIAAHGEHLDPDLIRQRCRGDCDQLSRWRSGAGLLGTGEVTRRLEEHADRLGLELLVDQVREPAGRAGPGPVAVPPPVLQAFLGAASEALTNVRKHSGVTRATVLVLHDRTGLQVLVADQGVGLAADHDDGYGVVHSVQERMQAVGGHSMVGPGPDGRGAVVALTWEPVPPDDADVGSDLLVRTADVIVGVGVVMAAIACALVLLGWPAYSYPWLALLGPLAPVLLATWILRDARMGTRIGTAHVVAAGACYVLVGALALLADPYCASLLGEGVMVDARVPLLATVLILAPRPGVLAALVATVVASHAFASLAWSARWVGCGQATASMAVYVTAGLVAAWLFARRMDRLAQQYSATRSEATQAEVRIRSQLSVRAEEELWVADTLSSASRVLRGIADGRLLPQDPTTRTRCAAEAASLRALLAVGRAPDPLRRATRIWLRLLHQTGCWVAIRGSFADCDPPPVVISRVGGAIDAICAMAPGSEVTLAAFATPDAGSLMLTASGPRVAHAGEELAARVHRVIGPAWRDYGADSISVEWTWPSVAVAASVPSASLAP